jgi:hypothetical protein
VPYACMMPPTFIFTMASYFLRSLHERPVVLPSQVAIFDRLDNAPEATPSADIPGAVKVFDAASASSSDVALGAVEYARLHAPTPRAAPAAATEPQDLDAVLAQLQAIGVTDGDDVCD